MSTAKGVEYQVSCNDALHNGQGELVMPCSPQGWHDVVKGYGEVLGRTDIPSETVERVIKFHNELLRKREYKAFTTFDSKGTDEMIILKKLKSFSFCEHHLLPMFGNISIGYIPDKKILGLSKFQRLVDKCSSKPTLQEYLTNEIADQLVKILEPKGVIVATELVHTCMFGRGVENTESSVNVQTVRGIFKTDHSAKEEFLMRLK